MAPAFPQGDVRDDRVCDTEPLAQLPLTDASLRVELPDAPYFSFAQLGEGVLFAGRRDMTLLRIPVPRIVGMCAEEQVCGVDASGRITPMKSAHSGRNWPVVNSPTDSVSEKHPAADLHPAVAIAAAVRRPNPTRS